LLSLDSWMGLPKMRNSVFDGLRDRRLADIQLDTSEMEDWSLVMEENCAGRNEIKSWVSSA